MENKVSVNKTVATVATVADSAREFDSVHVILCLAEASILIVKNDVLSVHPDPQGRLAIALLAAAEPHGAVLLAGEAVGWMWQIQWTCPEKCILVSIFQLPLAV